METTSNNGTSPLRKVIEHAADEHGRSLSALTVLSGARDPYRLDTPAGHRDGEWFALQVERFLGDDGTIHLRGLHYRISSAGNVQLPDGSPYINTDECWTWLCKKGAKAARWLGYVPFARIVDERNAPAELFLPEPCDSPYPYFGRGAVVELPAESTSAAYPWLGTGEWPKHQLYRIIFFGEKTSLRDILLPIAQRVGGELLLPTGESTDTMIAEMAARAAEDDRPAAVLYFSDFDPSGRQMVVSVSRKLQALRDLLHPNLDIRVHPVALTAEQVRRLNLPSTPLKETERRADKWRDVWGHEQTEIDAAIALAPDALREIAQEAVAPYFDFTLDRRVAIAEAEWRREARARLEAHPAYQQACGEIDLALEDVRQAVQRFEEIQEAAREQLEEDVEPPEIVVPEAEITVEAPPPLFDSTDSYASATEQLIHHKALEVRHE